MRTSARAVATGLATTGVLAAGGVAVAMALGTGASTAAATPLHASSAARRRRT